jgi:hypothetical protein
MRKAQNKIKGVRKARKNRPYHGISKEQASIFLALSSEALKFALKFV